MGIITRMRKQKAIYWAMSGKDEFNVQTFADPVEIACRWEDKQQVLVGPDGEEFSSSSMIYVDRDMFAGDYLKLGELEEDSSSAGDDSPLHDDLAFRVRLFSKVPNFKATEFLRISYI